MHQPGRALLTRRAGVRAPAGRPRRSTGCYIPTIGADQLIEVDREEIVDARLRRYYRLTGEGARRLAAEVDRLRANAAVAAQRLGAGGDQRGRPPVSPGPAA